MRKLLAWACWHAVMKWRPWLPNGRMRLWALGWAGWYAQSGGRVHIIGKDERRHIDAARKQECRDEHG